MDTISVKIKRLDPCKDIPVPSYASEGASGMDIRACVQTPVILQPGGIRLIPTGLAVAVPRGYEVQIRPRSGLALKHGIGMVNAPGTIDSDYRGEVRIILVNWGNNPFEVKKGDRIAQMVLSKVYQAQWMQVEALDDTSRGAGGFGHSGVE